MGARGPRAKPTNLKILQGNPGRRPLNDSEPQYGLSADNLKPPPYLSTYAKKEWKRIVPLLQKNKLLTDADITMLAAYCQAYGRFVEAEKLIRANGYTTLTDKGNVIQRPEVGIANKAMEEMLKFGREFGLTPSSRTQLHVENPDAAEDPFMTLLKARGSAG